MEILDFGPTVGRPLIAFGSNNVWFTPILKRASASVVCMRVQPGGMTSAHAAVTNQLFLVVEGEGWVRSAPGGPVVIKSGQAAFWTASENHESGSDTGMVVIILEGSDVGPELPSIA